METASIIGLSITILVNVTLIVWFSATLNASVTQLGKSAEQLGDAVSKLDGTVDSIHTRVTVLEDRLARFGANGR